MKGNKALEIVLLILKILIPVVLIVPLIFFSYRMVDMQMEHLEHAVHHDACGGMGLFLFAALAFNLAVIVLALALNIIGLLIACAYKSSPKHKKHIIYFACMFASPVVQIGCYLAISAIVTSIG